MKTPLPEPEGTASRRTFVRAAASSVGLCYAAALGYPVYCYLNSPIEKAEGMVVVNEVTLPDALKLAPGSVLMFKFGSRPAMLIHHTDGQWIALIHGSPCELCLPHGPWNGPLGTCQGA